MKKTATRKTEPNEGLSHASQLVILHTRRLTTTLGPWLGCNTGTGNSAVSQPRVAQVRVRFWNSGPEAVPQPVTAVSRVFAVLSVHCQPKSSCHIIIYILN